MLGGELTHGAVHSHARHAKLLCQRQFGWNRFPLFPNTCLDGFQNRIFDVLKYRDGGFERVHIEGVKNIGEWYFTQFTK